VPIETAGGGSNRTGRTYDAHVTVRLLRYSVGNENDPGDPWGRSELVIQPDGTARLEHHFSRLRTASAWTGHIDATALEALWTALDHAWRPADPTSPPVAGATLRKLTVEVDGTSRQAVIDSHTTSSLPGYTEAFDMLDGIIRQLSGDTVTYPTTQPAIVRDIAAVSLPSG
jgi:hypothetical protein